MTRKRILFMISAAPGQGALTHEAIDAILVTAAFDQDVGVLFTGDGVLQLAPQDDGASAAARDHAKALKALPAYEVTRIYCDVASLDARGLASASLALSPVVVDSLETAALIAQHDIVMPG
ncbi:MAG: sulfurtransferase complex subunit TusC [Gammaproteobacteria bacterium]|nr:sulfurtransferase complex subunit TusC [Gammaproteobacteria bacterium]